MKSIQTTTQATRISWIDMAKGYGTILVILAHIGSGLGRLWIYTFHMPLFFFLSGYVFSTKYSFGEFVRKKCKTMIVPYFCLGIPMVLYEAYVTYSMMPGKKAIITKLMTDLLVQRRLWTLWYIACLFFLNLLFYGLVKLCKKQWILAVISAVAPALGLTYYALGGGYLPWNMDVCLMALPFFYAGFAAKAKAGEIEAIVNTKGKKVLLFSSMLVINLVAGWFSIDKTWNGLEMFYSKYGSNPIFTYISAFAGIICIVMLAKCFAWKPIQHLGENTMLYYAWHQTIMMPVIANVMLETGMTKALGQGTALYNVVWLLGILGITTVIVWIMKKLRLNFVLGK